MEIAGLLNLQASALRGKGQEAAERIAEILHEYSEFQTFLERGPRSEACQKKRHVLREHLKGTIQELKKMPEETVEDFLLGYTMSTPLDIKDDVWTWGMERKERENDLKHTLKLTRDVMESLLRFLNAAEKRYASDKIPRGLSQRHQKELCQRLNQVFRDYYQEVSGEDPVEAEIDFLKFAFGEWNKDNVWSEPLPTTRRSLLTLLKD